MSLFSKDLFRKIIWFLPTVLITLTVVHFRISELEISYHINMINKEFHYALGFIIFVSLFMWFHVISHQNITNMHVVHYLAKLVQKNVSTKYFEKKSISIFAFLVWLVDHSKCPTYNSSLKKYFQNLQHYTLSHEPFKYEKSKKILLLNPLHKKDKNWGMETGNEEFQRRNCRVKNCYITSKRQLLGFSNKF